MGKANRIKTCLLLLVSVILFSDVTGQFKVRFEITGKPDNHTADTLYLAGTFNGWNPGDHAFAFQLTANGTQVAEINGIPPGIIEYKITRGSWSKVETSAKGSAFNNRSQLIRSDTTILLAIDAWNDDFPARPPVSTRSKNVFIADTAFFIPQLNRKRRIWIYLPDDYAFTKKSYPVLYMQDGQNLFDVITSSYGEWGIDEMMDTVVPRKQSIVIGIDHGAEKRMTEYNPYSSRFGNGEGDAYVDFLVNTLKPYIDRTYRTKPGRGTTAIAGSSMGGLISLYAVLKYPSVFGGAGIFSPAFWIAPDLQKKIDSSSGISSAVYFICGEKESKEMTTEMKTIYEQLKQKGAKHLFYKQVPEGKHNESFWRNEMYDFYNWLFSNQTR